MIRVGLAGAGGISGAHIPVWDGMEDAELVALCDIRKERLEKYPDRHLYTDFGEMLEKERLDILDICLPTYLHADYAIRAMERGIHVVTEKPLSLHVEDVERVYSCARRNHVNFMVAQVLRFWPEYELVKELYDSGKYGKLLSGNMSRLGNIPKWSWDNWMLDEERSGLVSYDLHIHDLDFMIYAFGPPTKAVTHRSKRPEQDYLHAVYEYDGFFIASEAAWYAAPYPFASEFVFQFEHAVVAWQNGRFMIYEDCGKVLDLSVQSDGDTGSIRLPKSDAYANELRYFTNCVKTGRFPEKVKQEELTLVIRLLNGMQSQEEAAER